MFWLGRREGIQQFCSAFNALLLYSRYGELPVVGLENQICGSPMFFSTAVTLEASAWDLGQFINLDDDSSALAEKIIPVVEKNIPIRISHAKAMTDAEKLIIIWINAIYLIHVVKFLPTLFVIIV